MKTFIVVLVSVLFTLNLVNADDCTCTLFLLTDKGEKDKIGSMAVPWSGSCTSKSADNGCKQACLTFAKTKTHDGDLNTHPLGPQGPNLGDLACRYIGHDVGLSTFIGQSKACNHPVKTMTLPTKQPFCCKHGVWPNGKC